MHRYTRGRKRVLSRAGKTHLNVNSVGAIQIDRRHPASVQGSHKLTCFDSAKCPCWLSLYDLGTTQMCPYTRTDAMGAKDAKDAMVHIS